MDAPALKVWVQTASIHLLLKKVTRTRLWLLLEKTLTQESTYALRY